MALQRKISILGFLILLIATDAGAIQQAQKQDPAPKPKQTPQTQKPPQDEAQKSEPVPAEPITEESFTRLMSELTDQIGTLTGELRILRKEAERNSTTLELMLNEERLSKIESKLDDMTDLKYQLDAREADLQRRLRNIQQEIILRAGTILRRDEAEAAVRNELNSALESTRSQRDLNQQRVNELGNQAEALRRRIEVLKKKLEPQETKAGQTSNN